MARRKLDLVRRPGRRLGAPHDARRSQRFHAFLAAWARRHMPERVTRFTAR